MKEYIILNFTEYFAIEIEDLQSLCELGLINLTNDGFSVSNSGKFLIRNVAVVFDKYYRNMVSKNRYSQVI
ncbi:MAG: hypothetical protein K2P99_03130 [Burkholderiales bacterium]|nr:hypothetical protein [Burkholderiales bacterium]